MEYCVVGEGIDKSYGLKKALDHVDIHVPTKSIYGLIGPNGAGKSTLLKCIMNLIHADGGNIRVFGNPDGMGKHELNRTGSLIEYPCFYDDFTGKENLLIHSGYMGYYDKERIDEVLEEVDLTRDAGKKVSGYSMGMRQRLAIARAILVKPELLILDEPINALDPDGIKKMRELLTKLNTQMDTMIIISSHILSEMDCLARDIGIMALGKIIKEIPLKKIHEENKDKIVVKVDDLSKAAVLLQERGIKSFKIVGDGQMHVFDLAYDTAFFAKLFVQNQLGLYRIDTVRKTLEDYFFEAVGENECHY